jgi:amino acid permease
MVACIILLIFNGVNAFLTKPFDVRTFIASYISVRLSLDSGNLYFRGHHQCTLAN